MSALPEFPPRLPDRGDLDGRHRHLGDGYDYAAAARAGAALCRSLLPAKTLAKARDTFGPGGPHHKPVKAPVRPVPPVRAEPPAPTVPTPYVPADGEEIPLPDEPEPEDWR